MKHLTFFFKGLGLLILVILYISLSPILFLYMILRYIYMAGGGTSEFTKVDKIFLPWVNMSEANDY